MSIIHDALKKVQDQTPSPAPSPSNTAEKNNGPSSQQIPVWLILTLIAVIVFIFSLTITKTPPKTFPTDSVASQSSPKAISSPTTPSPNTIESKPQTTAIPSENLLRVEGVMDMGTKKVALINGNIYETGQTVQGKTITNITLEHIITMDNGVEQTLLVAPREQ